MIKDFFNAVYLQIKDNVPEVRYIDIWNENLASISGANAWPVPAVFLAMEPMQWVQEGGHVRRANVTLTLHVIQRDTAASGFGDKRMQQVLSHLDLVQRIATALSTLRGDDFSTMMLTLTQTDHDHGELIDDVMQFQTKLRDTSSARDTAITLCPAQ